MSFVPSMANKEVTIHVAVEPRMKAALKAEARELTLPLSFVIRRILQDYLRSKDSKEQAA